MRIWVTRDEESGGPLSSALRTLGLDVVLEPVISRTVVSDALDEIVRLGPDDWLVLTSEFAIRAVPVEAARVPCVAVVGEPSRRAALDRALRVELVGASGTAELFHVLEGRAAGQTVLYARSSLARVPEMSSRVTFISAVLYETVTRTYRPEVADEVDAVAVASPSAVRSVGRIDLPVASIGPTTTAALRALGMEPWVEAAEPTFTALAQAIAAAAP